MNKKISIALKIASIISATILFIAIFNWPIAYYMFLRIVVFIGAVLFTIYYHKRVFIAVTFGLIAILFNPIFPVYLYIKLYWVPLDILTGILFLLAAFYEKPRVKTKESVTIKQPRYHIRDKMY